MRSIVFIPKVVTCYDFRKILIVTIFTFFRKKVSREDEARLHLEQAKSEMNWVKKICELCDKRSFNFQQQHNTKQEPKERLRATDQQYSFSPSSHSWIQNHKRGVGQ